MSLCVRCNGCAKVEPQEKPPRGWIEVELLGAAKPSLHFCSVPCVVLNLEKALKEK